MGEDIPIHPVVIAGGSGTRFWPLSRRHHPKQLLNLSGADSLLHATFARVASLAPQAHWWMVVGQAHAAGCREAAPEVVGPQVLVEPQARNTAPAVTLAALALQQAAPAGALMLVLPADHHVTDPEAFCAALKKAALVAADGAIVTLGIKPTHPETGYGYIQQGEPLSPPGAFAVQRFCEKPDRERAESFVRSGDYVWNAGIFLMRPQVYLAEVQRQLPDLYAQLEPLYRKGAPSAAALAAAYAQLKGISIDYGIMEKAGRVAVVPVDCGWSDVGSWSALGSVVPADAAGNVQRGQAVLIDSQNCVAYASEGHVVTLVGVRDLVVVHTPDATLVVPRERAQDVRAIVEALEKSPPPQHL
jgi:mannose-1-phosphate guanylyltransferase/mannose-6-phosphate isomerase